MSSCPICNGPTKAIFRAQVLKSFEVEYLQCETCEFIQTEEPYWLPEAYSTAIASMDVGLVQRNILLCATVEDIIYQNFDKSGIFLDYAGGYGLFVRLMRDKGINFYRQDIYCENIFAKYFDLIDLLDAQKFELVTAFEVFEHLRRPLDEIESIFQFSDSILFSTEIQPSKIISSVDDWWYFVPETGQHISLYSKKSLEHLSKKFSCNLYSNGSTLHLLTKRKLIADPFLSLEANSKSILEKIIAKVGLLGSPKVNKSLLQKDFEMYRDRLGQPGQIDT